MLIVLKSLNLILLEPSGPVQASNGIALPLPLPLHFNIPKRTKISSVGKEFFTGLICGVGLELLKKIKEGKLQLVSVLTF